MRALILLDKIMQERNMRLCNYIEKKIMQRLVIFAGHDSDPNEQSIDNLVKRSSTMFNGSTDSVDKQNSVYFMIILLHFME